MSEAELEVPEVFEAEEQALGWDPGDQAFKGEPRSFLCRWLDF